MEDTECSEIGVTDVNELKDTNEVDDVFGSAGIGDIKWGVIKKWRGWGSRARGTCWRTDGGKLILIINPPIFEHFKLDFLKFCVGSK